MKKKVLFVCIHNSARSQMAEAFLNQMCAEQFEAQSAGIEPGKLNPIVVEVMKELQPEYRDALLLTDWQGLTQDQMGKRLGLSASGAKSRVQRARGQLKKLLLDCCRFELDRRGKVIEMTCHRPVCGAC